jgi:hypothetical protein
MNMPDHLTNDLLVRAIDDELLPREIALVESHLKACEVCMRRQAEILRVSGAIESLVAAAAPEARQHDRDALVEKLDTVPAHNIILNTRNRSVQTIWWGGGIAAAIVLAVIFASRLLHAPDGERVTVSLSSPGTTLQVDGETFIPLPYSNPDLPLPAPHIVEMQVPVSSLASAGLVFEPVSNGVGPDRTVLADVLMGLDGQPLGVHVLSAE